ncbi:hypothetical protein HID58_056760, partial [Brassica napus]
AAGESLNGAVMSFEKKSPFLLECLNEQLTKDLKHQIFHTLSSVCLQKGLEPSLPNKAFHPHQKVIAPMNLQIEPPEKKKKNRTSPPPAPPSCPSFSLFPDEIFVNCLARISRMYYPTLSIISKSFRSLLSSTELYTARSHIGTTEQCLYVCLSDESYQSPQWFTLCINPNRTLTVSTIKKKKTVGKSLAPIPSSSDFPSVSESTLVVGSDIYVIGGPIKTELSMPKCTRPSSAVRILDCRTHTWRDAPSMIVPRNHALTCFYDGKIYVMGGCGELEEPWAEVFETNTQTWKPLSDPGTEIRNIGSCTFYTIKEIKGKIFFWNPNRAYAYDTSQDNWESYAELWESTTCLIDGGVQYYYIPKSACEIDGVWYFISYAFYHFRWTKDGGDWEVMKGLYSLRELYKRNGGSSRNTTKLVSCGGKLLLLWEAFRHSVSSCIVSLLPFDGLVSELEKREEEEANGEQQELRRRIRG